MSSLYYNYNQLNSRNSLFNFVLGERGVGKTYGKLKDVSKDYLRKQKQFIYLRRYNEELKSAASPLFNPLIQNQEFKETDIYYKGGKYYFNGEVAGYAIALSTANILKSTSFEKVQTIIFDEFLLNIGYYKYLPQEVTAFLEFYETVARLRDVKVFFLGNSSSITNPYFDYFNLTLPYNSEFKSFNNGLITVNYIKNENYRQFKRKTKFGKLIDGTEYGKYAIDNKMLMDNPTFIKKKTRESRFAFSYIINGHKIGTWLDQNTGFVYLSEKYDPGFGVSFVFNDQEHNDNTIKVTKNQNWIKQLIEKYREGYLYFENQNIKNIFLTYLNKK